MGAAKVHGEILIYESSELRWSHRTPGPALCPTVVTSVPPTCPRVANSPHPTVLLSLWAVLMVASSNTAHSQGWSSSLSCKASETREQTETWALHPSACWLCLSLRAHPVPQDSTVPLPPHTPPSPPRATALHLCQESSFSFDFNLLVELSWCKTECGGKKLPCLFRERKIST